VERSKTKRSTPRLSDLARHVVAPKGVVTTGWPAVERKCADLGITFRPWQPDVGRLILAKRADGKYAATIGGTGLSIPRQVGKTFLVGAIVFALCLLRPKLTVIWTAHRLRTAEETFGKMQAMAKRKRIAPHVLKIVLGSGEEEIQFRNGSRILFGARESGFGLGFDEVDVLIFDEAQRLRDVTLDDMVPATNQSRQSTGALLLFMGTPPRPTDPGEVFTRMRTEALTGEDDDTGWVEFGADEDYEPTPLPAPLTEADWKQIAKANPSFPQDTPRESILRMRKKLGPESFKREGAGIWDKSSGGGDALPYDAWLSLADPSAERGAEVVFGADVTEDRTGWTAVAWKRPDGGVQLMVDDQAPMPAYRLADRCAELTKQWGGSVVPPRAFEDEASNAGASVDPMKQGEFAAACGALLDAINEGSVHHGNQKALNDAVKAVRWRPATPSGERAFLLKGAPEIGPLVAAVRAFHGLTTMSGGVLLW
jgi:phage terminase large subunit-like protein